MHHFGTNFNIQKRYDSLPSDILFAINMPFRADVWWRETTNSNVRVSGIEKIFGWDEKKYIVGKAMLATK